jgi:hypothetical protein
MVIPQAVINLVIVLAPVWIMGLAILVDSVANWLYN